MFPSKLIRPAYADGFQCIGSHCEDTCCRGWSVPIDRAVYQKYMDLPAGPLRERILAGILRAPEGALPADGYGPDLFAKIQLAGANECPLLSAEHLCTIQAECGAALLSHTCATYPREVRIVEGVKDIALALSCPEAARHVLLKSIPLARVPSAAVEADNQHLDARGSLIHPWFLAIRSAAIELVLDRAYPLWQRLFLLGILCRRLDEIVSGELQSDIPSFLAGFERAVASGSLRRAMEKQPADRKAQLDAVLRLAGMLLHKSVVLPRFVGCIQAFATGIGNGPTATLESLTAQYKLSHNRYFAPFFQRNPQILENYLVNTIVRCQFPFGRDAIKNGSTPLMTKEFALLTAQFALMKGLLIGVAGFHREQFSAEHVVHTVQAAAKHFDHHPEFLRLAYELLVESRLDGAQGMAILLRDSDPAAPRPASPPKHVPLPQAGLGRKALPV